MKIIIEHSNPLDIRDFKKYLQKAVDRAGGAFYEEAKKLLGVDFNPSEFVVALPAPAKSPITGTFIRVQLTEISAYAHRPEKDLRAIFDSLKKIFQFGIEYIMVEGTEFDFNPMVVFDRPIDWLDGSNMLDEGSYMIKGKR